MTLSQTQRIFALNVAKLIQFIYDNGMECTLGEVLRTVEQQKIYLAAGATKTLNSAHLKKLAIDIQLFVNGVYATDNEAYKPLAEYWKSLHPSNVAGYDWGWDAGHFEMKY